MCLTCWQFDWLFAINLVTEAEFLTSFCHFYVTFIYSEVKCVQSWRWAESTQRIHASTTTPPSECQLSAVVLLSGVRERDSWNQTHRMSAHQLFAVLKRALENFTKIHVAIWTSEATVWKLMTVVSERNFISFFFVTSTRSWRKHSETLKKCKKMKHIKFACNASH